MTNPEENSPEKFIPVNSNDVERTQIIPTLRSVKIEMPDISISESAPVKDAPTEDDRPHDTELPDFLVGKYDSIENEEFNLDIDASLSFRQSLANYGERYQLHKLLASGGYGQIFLAYDKVLGRRVVIKSLRSELLQNDAAVEQFIGEAKLNSQLDHPGILPLFSLDGDSRGGVHLAMQLVRGISLKDYLGRVRAKLKEKVPSQAEFKKKLRERLEMFLRICEAIEYCHSRKIIHNDLKPDNIMIARYGQLYVMDWGSASFENTCQQKNMTGTPAYIAPERIRDRRATRQSDIFSLGMLLNEMVTLQLPISGKTSQEVLHKLTQGMLPPSVCINRSCRISSSLRAIIEKARSLDPSKRYSNVQQLAADIRNLLFHEEVKAKPDNFLQKWMRFLYHRPHFAYLLLVAVAAAVAGTLLFSVVREKKIANQLHEEMLDRFVTLSQVEHLSLSISRQQLQLREQLNGLGNALLLQMGQPAGNVPPEYFSNESFKPESRAKRPPGMIHVRAYPNAVSLQCGSWHFPAQMPAEVEKMRIINSINRQLNQWHATLMSDIFDEKENIINPLRQFLNQGALIRSVIASFSNGMVFCYPGTYRKTPSRFGSEAEFILRKLRKTNGIWWSLPEQDESGEWLIACWMPLRESSGFLLGAIGFELSYRKLIHPLQTEIAVKGDGSVYALVDEDDQLLFDSRFSYGAQGGETPKSYAFPALLRTIRRKGTQPQFEAFLHHKKYRISWTRIPFSPWLLIQHSNQEKNFAGEKAVSLKNVRSPGNSA